jgi:hypothetical protein
MRGSDRLAGWRVGRRPDGGLAPAGPEGYGPSAPYRPWFTGEPPRPWFSADPRDRSG